MTQEEWEDEPILKAFKRREEGGRVVIMCDNARAMGLTARRMKELAPDQPPIKCYSKMNRQAWIPEEQRIRGVSRDTEYFHSRFK